MKRLAEKEVMKKFSRMPPELQEKKRGPRRAKSAGGPELAKKKKSTTTQDEEAGTAEASVAEAGKAEEAVTVGSSKSANEVMMGKQTLQQLLKGMPNKFVVLDPDGDDDKDEMADRGKSAIQEEEEFAPPPGDWKNPSDRGEDSLTVGSGKSAMDQAGISPEMEGSLTEAVKQAQEGAVLLGLDSTAGESAIQKQAQQGDLLVEMHSTAGKPSIWDQTILEFPGVDFSWMTPKFRKYWIKKFKITMKRTPESLDIQKALADSQAKFGKSMRMSWEEMMSPRAWENSSDRGKGSVTVSRGKSAMGQAVTSPETEESLTEAVKETQEGALLFGMDPTSGEPPMRKDESGKRSEMPRVVQEPTGTLLLMREHYGQMEAKEKEAKKKQEQEREMRKRSENHADHSQLHAEERQLMQRNRELLDLNTKFLKSVAEAKARDEEAGKAQVSLAEAGRPEEAGKAEGALAEAERPEESVTETWKAEGALAEAGKAVVDMDSAGDQEGALLLGLDSTGGESPMQKHAEEGDQLIQEKLTKEKKNMKTDKETLQLLKDMSNKLDMLDQGRDDGETDEIDDRGKLAIDQTCSDTNEDTKTTVVESDKLLLDPLAKEIADEAEKFASHSRLWEYKWGKTCGLFKDKTVLSSMQFTHYVPGRMPYSSDCSTLETLQIISIKLTRLAGGLLEFPLSVYGVAAVRDMVDRNRNILFCRAMRRPQELKQNDPCLHLIGPSRAIVFTDKVWIEIQLRVKSGAYSQDKALISCARCYTGGNGPGVSPICFKNSLCTLELCLQPVEQTVQATILGVQVVSDDGSWPLEDGGLVTCSPLAGRFVLIDDALTRRTVPSSTQIVLIDSKDEAVPKGESGHVLLRRQVVSVQLEGRLDFFIKAYSRSGAITAEARVPFYPKSSNISQKKCFLGDARVTITVAWSLVAASKTGLGFELSGGHFF